MPPIDSNIILGIICVILLFISSLVMFFVSYRKKANSIMINRNFITKKEDSLFERDSISIQPCNCRIFPEVTFGEVLRSGCNIIKEEEFIMSKGVDEIGF